MYVVAAFVPVAVGRWLAGPRWSIMMSYHPIRHFHCRPRDSEREREAPSNRAGRCQMQTSPPSFKLKLLCTSHPPHTLTLATTIRKQGTLSSTRAYSREERQNIYNAQSSVGNGPYISLSLFPSLVCCVPFAFLQAFPGAGRKGRGRDRERVGRGGRGVSVLQFE